jgi:hypothetical protein
MKNGMMALTKKRYCPGNMIQNIDKDFFKRMLLKYPVQEGEPRKTAWQCKLR